ncbi:hypothetical protein CMQ_910 [Grosmannia clavigera kw1407]|uniref:Kinetoplast-associated protein n=1 Tax=Grosmannia clavigera (strain kw1407 / UAMH 11150) TaxID=655863 RepID=F0XFB3_GROCL|nr:uncharacterized protein CMQ_910 [Grosmannia clavigera kw1407]EFX03982.1 hypothetical protein CMQ_910 [Grosmannia clavigera kw1407]
MVAKPARPTSRIMSGSELSPLKILQGRVTGSAASSSPGSPEGTAESHRDGWGKSSVASVASVSSATSAASPESSASQSAGGRAHRSSSTSSAKMLPPPLPLGRTPRKLTSPDKRFPVKISVPSSAATSGSAAGTPVTTASPQQQAQPLHGQRLSLDEAIELNEGLKQAIEIFDDDGSGADELFDDVGDMVEGHTAAEEGTGADDTMTSTFSTFSAVGNVAQTQSKASRNDSYDSNGSYGSYGSCGSSGGGGSPNRTTANGSLSPMRTPRASGPNAVPSRTAHYESGSTTTSLLMDFTEQMRHAQYSHQGHSHGQVTSTPHRKSLVNLLDFEMPPLPTPRSIPSVTPRELEGLKSKFLSEISGLKATLSGKEAEVLALKTAVGDAEKRVGESMEQLREEQLLRQQNGEEKDMWERRGREMEEVLRKVKAEIVMGQREREELEAKVDESEKRREAAEMMAQEAETKMAVMRAGRATAENESHKTRSPGGNGGGSSGGTASSSQREVEIAVERVARELHAAYKAKHENKVAALKKSYEARWEKRVREVETAAEALARENETLRMGRDARMSRLEPGEEERRQKEEEEQRRRQREARDAAQIKELGAEVDKLEAVVRTVKADNAELRTLLEQERIEKGELVMLAEEMMSMQQQSFVGASPSGNGSVSAGAGGNASASASVSASASMTRSMSPVVRESQPRIAPRTPTTTRTVTRTAAPGSSSVARSRSTRQQPQHQPQHQPQREDRPDRHDRPGSLGSLGMTTPKQARPLSMHGTGRVSGLKPPSSSSIATGGGVASRIGRIGHDRKQSGAATPGAVGGLPRPGSGMSVRSNGGLLSSIEKMGGYRGRVE